MPKMKFLGQGENLCKQVRPRTGQTDRCDPTHYHATFAAGKNSELVCRRFSEDLNYTVKGWEMINSYEVRVSNVVCAMWM